MSVTQNMQNGVTSYVMHASTANGFMDSTTANMITSRPAEATNMVVHANRSSSFLPSANAGYQTVSLDSFSLEQSLHLFAIFEMQACWDMQPCSFSNFTYGLCEDNFCSTLSS